MAIVGCMGAGMEVLDGMHMGQNREGLIVRDAAALPECKMKTLTTPPSRCAAVCRVESELVSLLGKALARDATRRLWFVVQSAGWLHSMELHGCSG